MQTLTRSCRLLSFCHGSLEVHSRLWTRHYSHASIPKTLQGQLPEPNDQHHPFYNYTSGRWLYNEPKRLAERQLQFNVTGLCRAIARSADQLTEDLVSFTKLAEGGNYRIFQSSFKDGQKVIARLPYPCTIPRAYGVASEVATMEYLRHRGVPVPRIFDWSSTASNPVGSEYMIMETVPGKELAHTWYTMTSKERVAIMEKIVSIEKILFSLQFPASGSLYFKDFLPAGTPQTDVLRDPAVERTHEFCVGPSAELLWWYHGRDELNVDGGPWKTSHELLDAVGQRELTWLKTFGKPRFPQSPFHRELYNYQKVDPEGQMDNLSDYLKLAPHIVPDGEALNKPTLRHPDLSPSNIFIADSGEITGIIDWQRCAILPLFIQSKIPSHFQNYGDDDSENFNAPQLPDNFDSLKKHEKEKEEELYRRRQVHYFYLGFTARDNRTHFHGMGTYDLVVRNRLYDTASQPWEEENTSLKAELINTAPYWPAITSPAMKQSEFPLKYAESETKKCLDMDAEQKETDGLVQTLRDFIGVNVEGWVPNEQYNDARGKAADIKIQMAEAADNPEERREIQENWPFEDHEETD